MVAVSVVFLVAVVLVVAVVAVAVAVKLSSQIRNSHSCSSATGEIFVLAVTAYVSMSGGNRGGISGQCHRHCPCHCGRCSILICNIIAACDAVALAAVLYSNVRFHCHCVAYGQFG